MKSSNFKMNLPFWSVETGAGIRKKSIINKDSFAGDCNAVELGRAFLEFAELAREIKIQLKGQAGLLDEYLAGLFEGARAVICPEAAEEGAEALLQLSYLCAEKMEDFRLATHPFFGVAKRYIDEHPLPDCGGLEETVYLLLLCGDYLNGAAERYQKLLENCLEKAFSGVRMDQLLTEINRILGSGRRMKRLNHLFARRFLLAGSGAMFLQGAAGQLLSFLNMEGKGGKRAFQVLLELEEPGD